MNKKLQNFKNLGYELSLSQIYQIKSGVINRTETESRIKEAISGILFFLILTGVYFISHNSKTDTLIDLKENSTQGNDTFI